MTPEERADRVTGGDDETIGKSTLIEELRAAILEEREACAKILENGATNTPEWYRLRKFIDAIRARVS